MKIRSLIYSEASRLVPLAENFAVEAGYPGGLNRSAFLDFCTSLLALGRILIAEKDEKIIGALGFYVVPDPYSGLQTGAEAFWFVDKESRKTNAGLELFEAFEKTAIELGAKKLVMVHMANLAPEKLKALYESKGYKLAEQTFWKVL